MTDQPAAADSTTLSEDISRLQAAFRPVFDEQHAVWEREGPAAMAAFEATGATMDSIGGNCPVQAEGDLDGKRFYFRARGDAWSFSVGDDDDAAIMSPNFHLDREYGTWPDAGWMPQHEAIGFMVEAIEAYRRQKA